MCIRDRLEDISIKYLDPVGYGEIMSQMADKGQQYEDFLQGVKKRISEKLLSMGIPCEMKARVKHVYSIYRKMYTQNLNLSEIYDICAVRVIVEELADCYNVLGFIHDLYRPVPGRFKDYISTPKPNGYQSLHTVVIGREGIPFEVQIRTREMDRTAEYGVAAHWKDVYKRQALAQEEGRGKGKPLALLSRNTMLSFCECVTGARRLHRAVRFNLTVSLLCAVIGIALMYYLSSTGNLHAAGPWNVLLYLILWYIPVWPVSYTHLDVYKRQTSGTSSPADWQPCNGSFYCPNSLLPA